MLIKKNLKPITYNLKPDKGFTLVETIVAISILLTAVASAVALITQVTKGVSVARNRTVAANLAQEGVEAARAARDDSWIINESYDEPFQDGVEGCVTFIGDQITFTYTPADCDNGNFGLYWNESAGRFTHDSTSGPGTPFERRIVVTMIPNPVENDTYFPDPDDPPDVLQVQSIVSWSGNEIVVEDHLYDWR